jgi:hypothetical protein
MTLLNSGNQTKNSPLEKENALIGMSASLSGSAAIREGIPTLLFYAGVLGVNL